MPTLYDKIARRRQATPAVRLDSLRARFGLPRVDAYEEDSDSKDEYTFEECVTEIRKLLTEEETPERNMRIARLEKLHPGAKKEAKKEPKEEDDDGA